MYPNSVIQMLENTCHHGSNCCMQELCASNRWGRHGRCSNRSVATRRVVTLPGDGVRNAVRDMATSRNYRSVVSGIASWSKELEIHNAIYQLGQPFGLGYLLESLATILV